MQQTFKTIFGAAWDTLPLVFQKRYANRPYTDDVITVEGKMNIDYSKIMTCFIPFFRLFHVLVPYQGKDIPVKVDFRSQPDSAAVFLDRKFYFPDRPTYKFNSAMHVLKNGEFVEERMAYGIAWQSHYFYDGKKVVMQHKHYVLRLFGFSLPIPASLFVGRGYAQEEVIDDNTYRVTMTITHAIFGLMYRYEGNFSFMRIAE